MGVEAWFLPREPWELPVAREKFDPAKHPRDPDGKFGDGIGSGSALTELVDASQGTGPVVARVVDMISKVHSLPENARPVYVEDGDLDAVRGKYRGGDQTITLDRAFLKDHPADARANVAHELGHYIDDTLGGYDFIDFGSDTLSTPEWEALETALTDSPTYQRLSQLAATGRALVVGPDGTEEQIDVGDDTRRFIGSYLLSPKEVFARAYAQYVFVEAADDHEALDALRGRAKANVPTQWTDDEFGPIRDAMTVLFKAEGLA